MTDQPPLSPEAASDVATVAKGGAVQIVGQITQRSLSFFFTIVATNFLGRVGYGLYRQITQVLAIAGQLALAGFNYASMRWIARARAAGEHGGVLGAARVGLIGVGVTSGIVLIAVLVGADGIAGLFAGDDPEIDPDRFAFLIRLGSLYIPLFAGMQVLRYCTQAYRTMVPSVVVGNIVQPAVRFTAGVALFAAGLEVAGAVTSLVVSLAVGAIGAAWYFRRMLTPEERTASVTSQPGPMIRFAIPQAGASLLGVQTLGLGIIMLGILSDSSQVGLFGVALALQGPGTVFLGGIVNIWAPVVSDLHGRGEIERLGSLYKTINRWIATFSFPVFAALILEPDLFAKFFGKEFADAATVTAILAVGNFFYTGTGPTGYVLSMTGRPGINFINSAVAVALYIALAFAIVPEHGAVGMAVVDAIVTALVNSARVIEAKIFVGVQPFGRSFLKPIAATAVGAAVLLAWRLVPGGAVWLQATGVCVAAIVYLGTLRLLGIDAEERYVYDRIRKRALKGRGGRS